MKAAKLAVRSRNVLISGEISEATVLIENEKIKEILEYNCLLDCQVFDYGEQAIIPGLIDVHVHINEPGNSGWEGFETATKAAAAGGITMLVDMPLNSLPVTTTVDALNAKINSAKNKLYADCGFYGGVIPGNLNKLKPLVENGILGLKAFMIHSGLNEFPNVTENDLRNSLSVISKFDIPLLVHSELDSGYEQNKNLSNFTFDSFLKSRPREWENQAIKLLIDLCREFKCRIHIVHLSSSDAIDMIKKAKAEGLQITVETCPHYLFFASEEIPANDTRFKCTPPVRESENRDKLWNAVADGTIDFIASDHSPCPLEMKYKEEGNFEKAWGGIAGLQFSFSVVWTEAEKRKIPFEKIVKLMSENPSSFIGLNNKKGRIANGYDADFAVVDVNEKFIIEEKKIFHRHKTTPYLGRELKGNVKATFLRGKKIFENGKIISGPTGKIIKRNE